MALNISSWNHYYRHWPHSCSSFAYAYVRIDKNQFNNGHCTICDYSGVHFLNSIEWFFGQTMGQTVLSNELLRSHSSSKHYFDASIKSTTATAATPNTNTRQREKAMLMKFIILNFILHKSLIPTFHFGNVTSMPASRTLASQIERLTSIYVDIVLLIQFHSRGFYLTSAFVRINFELVHKLKLIASRHTTTNECHRLFAPSSMLPFEWISRPNARVQFLWCISFSDAIWLKYK